MQGIGDSPTGLHTLGAWVFGFYSDGIDKQQPVIVGSFGGIPESIPWTPKKADEEDKEFEEQVKVNVGFQDPKEEFPMGHHIFEQDTNRLARNSPEDHAFEIPEDLVPPQEIMIEDGLCPKKPEYGKKYYEKFDEAYVRKFGQGESSKLSCDDTVVGNDQCEDQSTKPLDVKDKDDDKCQFFLPTNNHPYTVYKFINRERYIPKANVFADPMHWEYWHEPENPWATQYPYNKVWEGYHKVGTTEVNNPTNKFVSEAYGYDKTIENYDGSDKEGIHRKQTCGVGSWGLGEEWDSTEGAQRYHRFHPSANYFEIDNDGNETRKIYGDSFEIDLQDRTILVKGDWNITVEGDKNELIEGNYNQQIMGDKNTDVRGDIKTHSNGSAEYHYKDGHRIRVDGDERVRISGSRETSILVDDYIESPKTEMVADEIIRKGGKSMIDEAFVSYKLKVHEMDMSICTLNSEIETWNNITGEMNNEVTTLSENLTSHEKDVGIFVEKIGTHTKDAEWVDETVLLHNEKVMTYEGCIQFWEVETETFTVFYKDILLFEQIPIWECGIDGVIPIPPVPPEDADLSSVNVSYPEVDGITQCMKEYNKCIDEAKAACITTLTDPRTLEDYTRFDWEKYHASIDSCKRSYEACVEANKGGECSVCSPEGGILEFPCMPCHDPRCPAEDKEYEFYMCPCECHQEEEEEVIKDPWLECEQEKP